MNIGNKDWAGRHNFPHARFHIRRDGMTIIRSNSPTTGKVTSLLREHHVKDLKKAFRRVRIENLNPRALKHINRCYNKVLSGKIDIADVVQILGDFQAKINPKKIHVERESKAESHAA